MFVVMATVLAYIALRKKLTYVSFGGLWSPVFRHAEGRDWGMLTVHGKMAVTLIGSSFLIKELKCQATAQGVEIELEEQENVGRLVQGGSVLDLTFVRDGCRIPDSVSWLRLNGSVLLEDGTRKRFKTDEPLRREEYKPFAV